MKPPLLASDTVPWISATPGSAASEAPLPRTTKSAAIVPPELGPATSTAAPSVMSATSAPDAFILVAAVVVTVTGGPLAVLMIRLLPFTCSSGPVACSSWAHPVTAVRAVPVPLPAVPGACRHSAAPTPSPAPIRTSAAAALASTVRRLGPARTRRTVRRGRTG